jgi:DNA transposition AAA+ family ATPase
MKQNLIVPTRNPLLLGETIAEVLAGRPGAARLAVVEGPAGTGKTSVAKNAAKQSGGIFFSVPEIVTACSLYSGIVNAANRGVIVELHSTQRLLERLISDLENAGWPPIFLDEADRLDRVRGGISLLEATRDIHDFSGSPIVLFSIGPLARRLLSPMGGLPEAFSTRVVKQIRFERASLEDAQLLAQRLLEDVKFDADLIAHCVAASGGSFRPLLALYSEIERLARAAGIDKIGLAKYQQLASFAGLPAPAPARRAKSSAPETERPKKAVA